MFQFFFLTKISALDKCLCKYILICQLIIDYLQDLRLWIPRGIVHSRIACSFSQEYHKCIRRSMPFPSTSSCNCCHVHHSVISWLNQVRIVLLNALWCRASFCRKTFISGIKSNICTHPNHYGWLIFFSRLH